MYNIAELNISGCHGDVRGGCYGREMFQSITSSHLATPRGEAEEGGRLFCFCFCLTPRVYPADATDVPSLFQ